MHVAIRAVCRNFAEEGRVGVYVIGFEKRDHFAHTIKNDFIALIDRANLALHIDTWPKARSAPNPEMRPLLLQPFRGNAIH